jgi:hypothetical protein
MRISPVFIFLIGTITCSAQPREVATRQLAWGGLYAQYNFTPSWNVNLDAQARYEYTDNDWFGWLIRPGLTWKAKNNLLFTAGVGLFAIYPNPNSLPPRPEWRPWQEIGRKFVINKHALLARVRIEQRFIRQYGHPVFEEDYSFSFLRTRFRCDYTYSFSPPDQKGFQLLASNEYMAASDPSGNIFFDQNRAYAGIGYKLNNYFTLQLVYLNLYLRKNRLEYEQHHIARFTLLMQFSKQEKPKPTTESGGS